MRRHDFHRGQGLVEYALLIALVALASIIIIGLAGVAIQRVYGLLAGRMGAKRDAGGAQIIVITGASCFVIATGSPYAGGIYSDTGFTGYFLKVRTNVPPEHLFSAGTELAVLMQIYEQDSTIVAPPEYSRITFRQDLGAYPDQALCPHSAVVQSDQGAIAVRPVDIAQIP